MYAMAPERCAALGTCTDVFKGMRIIASIRRAAPADTVARTTTTAAWGISLPTATVMEPCIPMSMATSIITTITMSMTTAAVAMMKSILTMSRTTAIVVTTIAISVSAGGW